jgi:hypothetical protein
MLNDYEAVFIYGLFIWFEVIFTMIFSSWIYGLITKNWTPYEKTVALLALMTGHLQNWHL